MKKVTTLILAAGLVLGAAFSAQAATQFGARGFLDVSAEIINGVSFNEKLSYDKFNAQQFMMTHLTFDSGNVKGQVSFQLNGRWGFNNTVNNATGYALGTDGVNIKTRQAWLDFKIPGTEATTRLGIQTFSLPQTLPGVGNAVLDIAYTAAAVVNAPINDMFSVTAFWARPIDMDVTSSGNSILNRHDEFDLFGLVLPTKYENYFTASPWFMVGQLGQGLTQSNRFTSVMAPATIEANAGMFNRSYFAGFTDTVNYPNEAMVASSKKQATPFWIGLPVTINYFDPFTLSFDVNYGSNGLNNSQKRAGWYAAARASYKLPLFTPSITAWYTSGDDKNPFNGSEMMPSVYAKQGFTNYGIGSSAIIMGQGNISRTIMGTWGVSLAATNLSFIEKLTHTLRVSYYTGTNSNSAANVLAFTDANGPGFGRDSGQGILGALYLTKKDHAFEFNFNNTYKIYDQLQLYANFNYIKPSISKSTWGQDIKIRDMYALLLGVKYSF